MPQAIGLGSVSAAIAVILLGTSPAAYADDTTTSAGNSSALSAFNVPAQPLAKALTQFAVQAGLNILFDPPAVAGMTAPELKDRMSVKDALDRLLEGTQLQAIYMPGNTVRVVRADQRPAVQGSTEQRGAQGLIHLAQSTQERDPGAPRDADSPETHSGQLQEIVVTATKREQRLQDVPVSIAVVTADEISRRGLVSAEDYLRGIPGVNQSENTLGTSVVIRGLEMTTVYQNFGQGTATASYFGETPTTNSAGITGGASIDTKLVDIERVEVLRGPQGTAFGNSSLGGAVRIIPAAPRADRLEGKVGASYSVTAREGGDNQMIQAMGNVPLIEDRLAIRASAFHFEDSGFYRNVAGSDPVLQAAAAASGAQGFATNEDDVGASSFTGGRVAALFRATEDLKFTFTYLTQKTAVDGWTGANRHGYEQALYRVGPEQFVLGLGRGGNKTDIDLANAVMEYDLGWGDVLATYSYTESGSSWAQPWTLFGTLPVVSPSVGDHREHNGEIRLSTRFDGAWNFLAGFYAEKLEDDAHQRVYWYGDPAANVFPSQTQLVWDYHAQKDLRQKAVFGEASWRFLPALTLTAGIRAYDYDRTNRVDSIGDFGTSSEVNPARASGTNFRGNLGYKPNDDTLLYAGWAQGFRLGTATGGLPPGICDVDGNGIVDGTGIAIASTKEVNSDSVDSYEIGGKFALLDRRLMISSDIFRAEWTDIPAQIIQRCGVVDYGYTTNVGKARSEGIELQANAQLTESVSLDAGASWIHARLTTDVPAQGLFAGDRLPSPKVNANLGVQYAFAIGGHKAFLRADAIYVGSFNSELPGTAVNEAGNYVKLDTSARVRVRDLSVDVFVRNLTNADDLTFYSYTALRMRPRTVGIQLSYDF